jgi:hypothetical protein
VSPRRGAALLGWSLLAVVVAAWLSVVEVLWLPLRIGGVLVPVSVAAAVLGNLLLVHEAHRLSRSRVVGVLPAGVWVVVALRASQRRPEGDLLLVGGGATGAVNLAFLLVGLVAAAFAVARVLAGPRRGTQPPRREGGRPQRGASR